MIPSPLSGTGAIAKTGAPFLALRDPAVASLLTIGEELNVAIVERHSARQYLVTLKGRMVTVDSPNPLRTGDELRVRVDQQHPQLVLRVLAEHANARDILTENLRFFRANPGGLLDNLARTEDLLAQAIVHPRLAPLLRNDIRAILNAIQALRYSGTAMGNRSYLRDYPADLGLLLESHLRRSLLASEGGGREAFRED